MFNRGLMDVVFRVAEDGITGADFQDGAIPESAFDANLQANVGLENGAVTVKKFANGAFSADATGRARMADLYLTTAKFGDEQVTAALLDAGITVFGPPVGAMGVFGGEVPPENWMECNGAVLNIADEPALYAVLGTFWGAPGTGKFSLPDYRGFFLRGWAHGATADPDRLTRTGGDHVGSTQSFGNKAHTHTWPTKGNLSNISVGPHNIVPPAGPDLRTLTSSSTGGQEARPKNKAGMVCIFAGA
jgi:microcystin-dependent protein